jgi:hypothetical protein
VDLIQKCAMGFQALLNYEYHFIIGRKGNMKEFYLEDVLKKVHIMS